MFKIHFNLCRKEETRVLTYTGITVNYKKQEILRSYSRKRQLFKKKTISKSTSFPRPSMRYFEIGGNEKRKCVN